jgi:hypothetical protein
MRSHLTELALRSLKPNGKQIKIWDRTTPGFGVRVASTPGCLSGNRAFLCEKGPLCQMPIFPESDRFSRNLTDFWREQSGNIG